MATLESCPKHNMVTYFEKTNGNVEFHEIIDFLTRSSIHYALIGKKNSGNVTLLFPSMLAQPTEDEGAVSERPSEIQPTPSPTHPREDQSEPQPVPFLRPSSSNPLPDSIPEGSGRNHGGQSSSDRSQSGNEDGLTLQNVYDLCVSLCKQGRKRAKSEPTVHKDPAFDDLDDAMDYMEPEDAHDKRTIKDSEETRVRTNRPKVSTKKLKVSADKPNEGTAKSNEGTVEPKDGNSYESAAPTTLFRDDETIAQFLITMSQNKTKQKGFEIKDTDRPRTTTERSGRRLKMKAPKRSKRQKTDSDHEEENQLRIFLKIVSEEEEKIDYEVLGTRYPIINWESKFYDYSHFRRELIYYKVFRADGSSRWIKTFSEMIKFFDRMDLVKIHSLVMKRFETTSPEGIESKEYDKLWKNQEESKLQSWIFY
ncbi:hypothetical protein Tco_0294387 [Tanacetum coccineum]